jgi:ABC-2 type transport system ATP-binding protein
MTEYAVELRGLSHAYGRHLALDDVNLSLVPGKIYGLLGRNGAGKTTLINILSACMFAGRGQALVYGKTVHEHADVIKRICVVREKAKFTPTLSIQGALKLCARLYPNWDDAYARKLLKLFDLNPKKRVKQLSRGMESSLGLTIGLASRADVTVFDEPSLGLDAVARENFYDQLIHEMEDHPRTIIISTHLIDEVSRVFEEVVIIDKGKVLRQEHLPSLLSAAVTLTGTREDVTRLTQGKRVLHSDELGGMTIVSVLREEGDAFPGVQVEPLPLQKLFVYLTEGEAAQ